MKYPLYGYYIVASYLTVLPVFGFFVRLLDLPTVNSLLTVLYAVVYWWPYSALRYLYVTLFYGHRKVIFRNPDPSFVRGGSYVYDAATDIYRSGYDLDDHLEEWGWAEYLDLVYMTSFTSKYNDTGNFKQALYPLLKVLAEAETEHFRVLDIGQGPGNSTLDIRRAVCNAEICCLDISEKLIRKAQRVVPDALFFKGSMMDTMFHDASFNIILNIGGINETCVQTSLAETWRIAKPRSLILIGDENFDATSYMQKMACVAITNITFMQSYRLDGSATRKNKNSVQIIDTFLKEHENECTILKRLLVPGLVYMYAIMKTK